MNNLVIQLTGEIQNSNFDEWKDDLVQQIRSVNNELTSDAEFSAATKHVKQFKVAEKALKNAKQSAIEQAADINSLFDAIDAVAEETRQVRLSLERQIKSRKLEIKQENIQTGIDQVTKIIAEQPEDFQLVSHDVFLNEEQFEDAVKGKASTKGMKTAIKKLCAQIKEAVESKAAAVKDNVAVLDTLQADHQLLFQDRAALLDMSADKLEAKIDQRIASWNEQKLKNDDSSEETVPDKSKAELPVDLAADPSAQNTAQNTAQDTAQNADRQKRRWQITIELLTGDDTAEAIVEQLKGEWEENDAITSIALTTLKK